jgi:hypothetical protein
MNSAYLASIALLCFMPVFCKVPDDSSVCIADEVMLFV